VASLEIGYGGGLDSYLLKLNNRKTSIEMSNRRRWAAEAGSKQFAQRLSRRQECGALRNRSDFFRSAPPNTLWRRDIVVPAVEPPQMRRDLNKRM